MSEKRLGHANDMARVFDFQGSEVRGIVDEQGDPWFVAKDVCAQLGIVNHRDAVDRLDADEKDGVGLTDAIGRVRNTTIISHPGAMILTMTSRSPAAKPFKRWLAHDVLESIRKTGSFGINIRDPRQLESVTLQLVEWNRELQDENKRLSGTVEAAKPKVRAYDELIDAEGIKGLTLAGKALGLRPRKFIDRLKHDGYLYYREGALVPYQRFIDLGLFQVRSFVVRKKCRLQACITQKGFDHFWRQYGCSPSPDSLESTPAIDKPRGGIWQ